MLSPSCRVAVWRWPLHDSHMSKPARKRIRARVPAELAAQVDHFVEQYGRTRAWATTRALEAWVCKEQERLRLTNEGLDSVATGRVVEHTDVAAWAESLKTPNVLPRPRSKQ